MQETIGQAIGNEEWRSSGAEQKDAAINEMRQAGEQREEPSKNSTMGKMEESVGKAVGCEGMENEGQKAQ